VCPNLCKRAKTITGRAIRRADSRPKESSQCKSSTFPAARSFVSRAWLHAASRATEFVVKVHDHKSRTAIIANYANQACYAGRDRVFEASMNRRQFNFGLLGATGAIAFGRFKFAPQKQLRVNGRASSSTLTRWLEFGKNPQGGVQPARLQRSRCRRARICLWVDAQAKLGVLDRRGRKLDRASCGSDKNLPPLLFGSHIDSVPEGGNYDGDVGSLGAIEVAQTLAENNIVNAASA